MISVIVMSVLSFTQANADQSDKTCSFKFSDVPVNMRVKYDNDKKCYSMDVTLDGQDRAFDCSHTKTGTMNADQIAKSEETQWLLNVAKVKPETVTDLIYHSVMLDDDGGGLVLLDTVQVQESVKREKRSGIFTFMGGARGYDCSK